MELNKRITALENELKVTKGEIKKLLVDIREILNNMENPFYDVRKIEDVEALEKEKEDEYDESAQEAGKKPVDKSDKREKIPEKLPKISLQNGIDIFTLTELMRWVDYTLATIGRSKLNEILDLYALTGHLSEKVKEVISKIANLSSENVAEEGKATMKDHITVICQLNAILNPDEDQRVMMRSIYEEMPWRSKMEV
ncbi:MAG: FlaD/FlaE family flagellar protein [Candidatus Syntropharchaeia archaeon]